MISIVPSQDTLPRDALRLRPSYPYIYLSPPWLTADLGRPHAIMGWPVVGPAFTTASSVTWLQVENADLPCSVDPDAFFLHRARREGIPAEIGLMTAADITHYALSQCESERGVLSAVATLGIGNGESVFPAVSARAGQPYHIGTINILAVSPCPLTQKAHLEAISIVAEARTAAVMDLGRSTGDGRLITGTGTDCIVVAAPCEGTPLLHCGLHTELGSALGEATFKATRQAHTHSNNNMLSIM